MVLGVGGFFQQEERVNVLAAIFLIVQDASPLLGAPSFNRLAREKRDLRRDKIIIEKISRRRPSADAFRTNEVNDEVWYPEKQDDERLRPAVTEARTNPAAGKFVEQRISARRLVNRQVHPAARFQDAEVFNECPARIFGVMDDAVGDYDVSGAVSKWKMEIVTNGSGPPVALHGESERNAAAVQSDTAKAAPSEKSEDATRTAADIEY